MQVAPTLCKFEDRIGHQLAGTMIGDLTTPTTAGQLDTAGL